MSITRIADRHLQKLKAEALSKELAQDWSFNRNRNTPEEIARFILGGFSNMTDRTVRRFIEQWASIDEYAFNLDGRSGLEPEDLIRLHMRRWRAESRVKQVARIIDLFEEKKCRTGHY